MSVKLYYDEKNLTLIETELVEGHEKIVRSVTLQDKFTFDVVKYSLKYDSTHQFPINLNEKTHFKNAY